MPFLLPKQHTHRLNLRHVVHIKERKNKIAVKLNSTDDLPYNNYDDDNK